MSTTTPGQMGNDTPAPKQQQQTQQKPQQPGGTAPAPRFTDWASI